MFVAVVAEYETESHVRGETAKSFHIGWKHDSNNDNDRAAIRLLFGTRSLAAKTMHTSSYGTLPTSMLSLISAVNGGNRRIEHINRHFIVLNCCINLVTSKRTSQYIGISHHTLAFSRVERALHSPLISSLFQHHPKTLFHLNKKSGTISYWLYFQEENHLRPC